MNDADVKRSNDQQLAYIERLLLIMVGALRQDDHDLFREVWQVCEWEVRSCPPTVSNAELELLIANADQVEQLVAAAANVVRPEIIDTALASFRDEWIKRQNLTPQENS